MKSPVSFNRVWALWGQCLHLVCDYVCGFEPNAWHQIGDHMYSINWKGFYIAPQQSFSVPWITRTYNINFGWFSRCEGWLYPAKTWSISDIKLITMSLWIRNSMIQLFRDILPILNVYSGSPTCLEIFLNQLSRDIQPVFKPSFYCFWLPLSLDFTSDSSCFPLAHVSTSLSSALAGPSKFHI